MSHETDEALMERVAGGDAAAFDALYDRHASRALRVARASTRDAELAAEAVQDAFVSIWRKSHRYSREKGSFAGWAMTVVHNRTIDLVRREAAGAQRVCLDDAVLNTLVDRQHGPPEAAALIADARRVREGLEELPPPQREAVILAFYGGLSHRDIAAHLSVPLGTVKGRMRMALEKLSDSLGSELAHAS